MKNLDKLIKELKAFYKKEGRSDLPWRKTKDPYKILVSEVMLQQTQVKRVLPFHTEFMRRFPTAQSLAKAPLSEVLVAWQGLGYNRRGRYLHEAAKILAKEKYTGQRLPGVGPYTRGAVLAFAYNKPEIFIETNIRTVFLHHCFQKQAVAQRYDVMIHQNTIADSDIVPLIAAALKKSKMQPRDFYAALMDYGAFLKASGVKLNSRSKHYTKQSRFKGSARQLRGALLRELLKKPATLTQLTKNLSPRTKGEVERVLARLVAEGLVTRQRQRYRIGA